MISEILITILEEKKIAYSTDVSLKDKTWVKRGGTVLLWITPINKQQLIDIVNCCNKCNVNFEIVGNTSNCYFTENYNPEVVISTVKIVGFNRVGNTICCDCGYNLIKLSNYCIDNGIGKYEGFIGLPGTVGGAVINNSGSYGSVISDVVQRVEILEENGHIRWLSKEELHYKYRTSILKQEPKTGIVLSVEFDTSLKESTITLRKRAEEYRNNRKRFQENNYLNLGSIHSELDIFSKHLIRKIIFILLVKAYGFLLKDDLLRQKASVFFFLLVFNKLSMKKFVSNKNINCFVWKNNAYQDHDFFNYLSFMKSIAQKSEVEIQIKK